MRHESPGASRTARSRYRPESTRARNLACGKCRNVRNKTLPARSGRCSCTGPPLRSTMGTVDGSTPSCLETSSPVCQPRAHTAHTASKVVPVQAPMTPTTAASIILLSCPLGPFYSHRVLRPDSRYHWNRKISQWTDPRIWFPSRFLLFIPVPFDFLQPPSLPDSTSFPRPVLSSSLALSPEKSLTHRSPSIHLFLPLQIRLILAIPANNGNIVSQFDRFHRYSGVKFIYRFQS